VLPGQCCHTSEGAVIWEHGKMLDSLTQRKLKRPGGKKIASVPLHSSYIPHKVMQDSTAALQSEDSI
jgi:hypothetical protein